MLQNTLPTFLQLFTKWQYGQSRESNRESEQHVGKRPSPAPPGDQTQDSRLCETLADSASFLATLLAELGSENSDIRRAGIELTGRLCAVARYLGTDQGAISSRPAVQELAKELLQELERIAYVSLVSLPGTSCLQGPV